jgi:ubiquinone/menaquinone biosynthesis C-methylase UbiE
MKQDDTENNLIPEAGELFDGTITREAFMQIGEAFVNHYLIGRCHLKPYQAVLDIGSGNGSKARPLTRYLTTDGSYLGFDIVRNAIDWCRDRYRPWPNFRFEFANLKSDWYNSEGAVAADEYLFPCHDDSFDVAFMSSVATHLLPDALAHYLRESYRVLKPGGRLLVTFFLMSDERRGVPHPAIQGGHFERIAWNLWTIDLEKPSRGVAYHEVFARGLFEDAGFHVAEQTFGTWGGTDDVVGALQDTVLAVKPRLKAVADA